MQRTLIKQFSTFNFILHKDLPVCVKCVHFIGGVTNYPYEPIPDDMLHGKCNYMVTGEIDYNYAQDCRNIEYKCGLNGKYFSEQVTIVT